MACFPSKQIIRSTAAIDNEMSSNVVVLKKILIVF